MAKLSAAERSSAESATKLQQAEDVVRDLTVWPNGTAYRKAGNNIHVLKGDTEPAGRAQQSEEPSHPAQGNNCLALGNLYSPWMPLAELRPIRQPMTTALSSSCMYRRLSRMKSGGGMCSNSKPARP